MTRNEALNNIYDLESARMVVTELCDDRDFFEERIKDVEAKLAKFELAKVSQLYHMDGRTYTVYKVLKEEE